MASVSERCVIGVGGMSEMSTSRRGAVAERHLILRGDISIYSSNWKLYSHVDGTYRGAVLEKAGRSCLDDAVAFRARGRRARAIEAMTLDFRVN
jgi:hypothetical protein